LATSVNMTIIGNLTLVAGSTAGREKCAKKLRYSVPFFWKCSPYNIGNASSWS